MKKKIIVLDGPRASGKTTISFLLADRIGFGRLSYKSLGLANVFSRVIGKLLGITNEENDEYSGDPVLRLGRIFNGRLGWLIFLLEAFYKVGEMVKTLVVLLVHNGIVIDEFVVLRTANYVNLHRHGLINKKLAELLVRMDVCFLRFLSHRVRIKYLYVDRPISFLVSNWLKREGGGKYPVRYLILVRLIWRNMEELFRRDIDLKRIVIIHS